MDKLVIAALTRETATSRALCLVKDGDRLSCSALKGMDESVISVLHEQLVPLIAQQVVHYDRPFRWLLPQDGQLCETPF
jgi:hypothetical protein